MGTVDLTNIFDDCYNGYDDITSEITLTRNKEKNCWENESVKFYKDETLGWRYSEKKSNNYNYGYESLEEAITKYTGGLTSFNLKKDYCASRQFRKEYHKTNFKNATISCKVIVRYFEGECNNERFENKLNILDEGINKLLKA